MSYPLVKAAGPLYTHDWHLRWSSFIFVGPCAVDWAMVSRRRGSCCHISSAPSSPRTQAHGG
eukprot:24457-Eustigmatos_ZCMA.PRE.1